ncbi:hypothetical protein [Streptomyces sp. NPDC056169]
MHRTGRRDLSDPDPPDRPIARGHRTEARVATRDEPHRTGELLPPEPPQG